MQAQQEEQQRGGQGVHELQGALAAERVRCAQLEAAIEEQSMSQHETASLQQQAALEQQLASLRADLRQRCAELEQQRAVAAERDATWRQDLQQQQQVRLPSSDWRAGAVHTALAAARRYA